MQEIDKSRIKGWQSVLMIIGPYIFFVGIFQLVGSLIAKVNLSDVGALREVHQNFIISFFGLIGTVLIVWFFKRKIDDESFWEIGLHTKKRGKDIIYGITLGLVTIGLGFLILLSLDEIRIVEIKFKSIDMLFSFLLFISVAFNEEILMRGFVLNNLMKSFNKYLALIISSIIFSLLHLANPSFSWIGFFGITLAGLLLGLSYIYTKNIWFPIALHFSWNFFQGAIFGFNVSGVMTYSFIQQNRLSDTILNGGKFGFEGSILSIVFLIICLFVVWGIFHNETKIKSLS